MAAPYPAKMDARLKEPVCHLPSESEIAAGDKGQALARNNGIAVQTLTKRHGQWVRLGIPDATPAKESLDQISPLIWRKCKRPALCISTSPQKRYAENIRRKRRWLRLSMLPRDADQ